jgi:hypothetical protein
VTDAADVAAVADRHDGVVHAREPRACGRRALRERRLPTRCPRRSRPVGQGTPVATPAANGRITVL